MTPEEYKARNLQGFEGDEKLAELFQKVIEENGLQAVIETGTYLGGTTRRLAKMAEAVLTIEQNDDHYREAAKNLAGINNVTQMKGDSATVLNHVLPHIGSKPFLLFLDAHWHEYWPIHDELKAVAKAKLKPVIIIHDFYNPLDPSMGYDSYKGRRLDIDFVKEGLDEVYGTNGYTYTFNTEAEGARRGVLVVTPR